MTLQSNDSRDEYFGDGIQTVFPVTFQFFDNHLLATLLSAGIETTWVEGVDYSISGSDVVANVAPAAGDKLTIIRNVPFDQQLDYVENDNFPAQSHENGLDKLTMMVQQLNEEVVRSVKSSVGEGGEFLLPSFDPAKVIGWDDTEPKLVNYVLGGSEIGTIPVVPVSNYSSLEEAQSSIGSNKVTLMFDALCPANQNVTFGDNVMFWFPSSVYFFTMSGNFTITVHSPYHIIANSRQKIIDTVNNSIDPLKFSEEGVVPVGWFGDNTSATINIALACTPLGGTTLCHAGVFTINETVKATARSVHLKGAGNFSGGFTKVNDAFHGTIFNSTISDGSNVVEIINNTDDNVYVTTKVEKIAIQGSGSDGKGIHLSATGSGGVSDSGGLQFSYVKNCSVEGVGGVGVYVDHWVWSRVDLENINIVEAGSHGFHIIGRGATSMAAVEFKGLRTNYTGGWGYYLEGVNGSLWSACKSEHDLLGGLNMVDKGGTDVCKYNTFVNCQFENALFGTGTPAATGIYMDSAFQNTFINCQAQSTDNPAVVMVGAQYNSFYSLRVINYNTSGVALTGPDSRLFKLDGTCYNNKFIDVYAGNSNLDYIVEDENLTNAANLFTFKRLDPGVTGEAGLPGWTSEVCPPITLNFSKTKSGPVFWGDRTASFNKSPMPLNFPTITATESLYILSFDAGTTIISPGQILTGGTSGATGTVRRVILQSGSWEGNNADGYIILESATGTPFIDNETITDPLGGSAIADGTGTAKANALDVSNIYRGVVDVVVSPTTIEFFVGGTPGQEVKLMNRSGNTELILDHSAFFRIQGGANFIASQYDSFSFRCRINGENEEWWMTELYEY